MAAFWIDHTLLRPNVTAGFGAMAVGALLIALAVLVFGTLYSFAGIPALAMLCLYAAFTRPGVRAYAGFIIGALLVSVLAYIRFYYLAFDPPPANSVAEATGAMAKFLLHPRFLAAYLGSATLGRTLWEDRITSSDPLMLWNGLFVAAAYVLALWIFFRTRMYQITWLPLMMIAYSVGVGVLVLIGRGQMFGWTGGTNYWYAVHPKFALAGCLWIFAHGLLSVRASRHETPALLPKSRLITIACTTFAVIFVASMAVSNYYDWRRAPYVRRYFEEMIPYGLAPLDEMPVDAQGNTPFRAPLDQTVSALRVFREHGLTFYAPFNTSLPANQREHNLLLHGEVTEYARLGPGWYEREGSSRWISGRAQIIFHSGPQGKVSLVGYLSKDYSPNVLVLSVDGKEIFSQPLSEGAFSVQAVVPAQTLVTLTIVLQKHFVPSAVGLSADLRDLGAIIGNVVTR